MKKIFIALVTLMIGVSAIAQVEEAGGVRRRDKNDKKQKGQTSNQVSDRMQGFFEYPVPHDADLVYSRTIYRQIDLSKDENAPLYFPEDVIDGKQNLFRTMFNLVVDGQLPAYEYLDGREVFTDQYKIDVKEMLDRFDIYYKDGDKNKKFIINEADVPTNMVLNYYIIEKWEFDRRTNRMLTRVEAICPVLNKYTDFEGTSRYPMFWVKFDNLRPYIAQQYIFLSDDNNLEQYSIDDYFTLGMYKGDIYKTLNMRNLSMQQMYPDPDALKQAQDSIDNRLRSFGKNLWVPTREEYLAMKEAEEAAAEAAKNGDVSTDENGNPVNVVTADGEATVEKSTRTSRKKRTSTTTTTKKKTKAPKVKTSSTSSSSSSGANSSANKSVRRRKK